MSWVYVLHNNYQSPYIDTAFPYLISIDSYFHFHNKTYQVMEYLPLDENIEDAEYGQEMFDDAEFCVICNQVDLPFDYNSLLRDIKIKQLGI